MLNSGSLCPAAKSAEIIGDKWVLLILRELLFGASRFNDFQRALPRISPTILSKRLRQMEKSGLIIRKISSGHKTKEYRLTRCGRELAPIIEHMGRWGLRWARRRIRDEDFDVGSFMWDFHRTLNAGELPDGETVICVKFLDQETNHSWWLIVNDGTIDLCTDDPGKDVDLYIAASLEPLIEIWMGDVAVKKAIADDSVMLTGAAHLIRSADAWFPRSMLSDIRPMRMMD